MERWKRKWKPDGSRMERLKKVWWVEGEEGQNATPSPFIIIIIFISTESHFYPPQPPQPPHPPLLLFLKKINNNKIRRETESGKQSLI